MRRAEQIYATSARRIWLGYLPAMLLLAAAKFCTEAMANGVSVLAGLLAMGLAIATVCDLVHTESAANAADRAESQTF